MWQEADDISPQVRTGADPAFANDKSRAEAANVGIGQDDRGAPAADATTPGKPQFSLALIFASMHPANCVIAVIASAIIAFGLYNVHSYANITEGGVLGLTLLLEYWFGISPAITNFVASALCYALGWRLLGGRFLAYSAIATVSYSAFYAFFEQFDAMWPQLADMPLAASLVGAVFVGVGAGLCVRAGGAQCGDDALAMSISHAAKVPIQWVYLASDAVVLLLSLSYLSLDRIAYSLVTVVLSGQIIGFLQRLPFPWEKDGEGKRAV